MSTIFNEKKKANKKLKDFYGFKNQNKVLGMISLSDEQIIDTLLDGLEELSCNFVIKTESEIISRPNIVGVKKIHTDMIEGFDFIVIDNALEGVSQYFKSGIIPLAPKNHYLGNMLKEFDPLENEGNSFLYKEGSYWSIYSALIRFLENMKFPMDHRNLVKNIIKL